MKEILFRGQDFNTDKWVYGYVFQGINQVEWYIITIDKDDLGLTETIRVKPETIGQYTGLEDSEGKKIFEVDIYLVSYFSLACGTHMGAIEIDQEVLCVVKYDQDLCAFVLDAINKDFYVEWASVVDDGLKYQGNIHDNPELLK